MTKRIIMFPSANDRVFRCRYFFFITTEFEVSRALLSQSLAFYLVSYAISTLVWGPLSDRLGRRTVVLSTLLLYLFASMDCASAGGYAGFLFFRLLQGVAAGGGLAAGRIMIRDVYSSQEAQRAMSRVMMLFALALPSAGQRVKKKKRHCTDMLITVLC